MIYNFYAFLKAARPLLDFNCPGFFSDSDDTVTALIPTGGETYRTQNKEEITIQIQTRSRDCNEAYKTIKSVYDTCYDRYHCVLPTISVRGTDYAAVSNANINPLQEPESFGKDEAGRWIYIFNVIILAGKQ